LVATKFEGRRNQDSHPDLESSIAKEEEEEASQARHL
jgi:hypothetical protein